MESIVLLVQIDALGSSSTCPFWIVEVKLDQLESSAERDQSRYECGWEYLTVFIAIDDGTDG